MKLPVMWLMPHLLLDNNINGPSCLRLYLDEEVHQWFKDKNISITKLDTKNYDPSSLGRQYDDDKIYVRCSGDGYPDDFYYLVFEDKKDAMLFKLRWC